jgi:hypothetical protein
MVDFSNILPNVLVFIDDYVYLNNFYYLDNAYFSYAIFNVQCSSVIRTWQIIDLFARYAFATLATVLRSVSPCSPCHYGKPTPATHRKTLKKE